MIMLRETREPELRHCIYCGRRVPPYTYSSVGYGDIGDYGNTLEQLVGEPGVVTYECACSEGELVAPNQMNTGTDCAKCGCFMTLFAAFCGVCGNPMRPRNTTEEKQ